MAIITKTNRPEVDTLVQAQLKDILDLLEDIPDLVLVVQILSLVTADVLVDTWILLGDTQVLAVLMVDTIPQQVDTAGCTPFDHTYRLSMSKNQ